VQAVREEEHRGQSLGIQNIALGYRGREYAESLSEFGQPLELQQSHGWLLVRDVPGAAVKDAMGCYPLFSCLNWDALADDLAALDGKLVSASLVTDPFGGYSPELLAQAFRDVARPFKDHFCVDFSANWREQVDSHHRRNIRYAAQRVEVERVGKPIDVLDDWVRLYDCLIARHAIKGITAFSRVHFDKLLRIPDVRAYRAMIGGRCAGMVLWMLQGDVAYYHLGAYDDEGYVAKVSYALFDVSLNDLCAEGYRRANLGGAAGAGGGASGLSRFKEGWSNLRKLSYFCGCVLNQKEYDWVVMQSNRRPTEYFPVYRAGEFA